QGPPSAKGTPHFLANEATNQDSALCVTLDDETHQESPSSSPRADKMRSQRSSPAEGTSDLLPDEAMNQDSPLSLHLADDKIRQEPQSMPHLGDDTTSQGSSSLEGPPSLSPPGNLYTKSVGYDLHITTMGNISTPIVIDDSEDRPLIGPVSNHVRRIMGNDVLDDEVGSECSGKTIDDPQQRGFDRASRRKGRMNQSRDTDVASAIR
ncbi:hypothetical protein BKA61DRAFT_283206, partial [Leptodontidium sp. MPI-SDFR-AT-0119]